MIAAWMLWSIGAGMLLLVAGLAAERLLRGTRCRWVWVAAGVGTVLLTALRAGYERGDGGGESVRRFGDCRRYRTRGE